MDTPHQEDTVAQTPPSAHELYEPSGMPPSDWPLPVVLDTQYFRATGIRLNFDQPGAWELVSVGHSHGPEVITSEDGPIDEHVLRGLRRAYPHVSRLQGRPARIDETYGPPLRDRNITRRLCQLLGIEERTADAILTIAAEPALGWKFTFGRWEITGDDDDQSFRIRSTDGK